MPIQIIGIIFIIPSKYVHIYIYGQCTRVSEPYGIDRKKKKNKGGGM